MDRFLRCAMLIAGCSTATIAHAQVQATPPLHPDATSATTPQGEASDPAAVDPAALNPSNEIVVTGVRASLERAARIKRNADVVADAISAEDIGKFPDANVADALQRITGVQISRTSGGEGRFVSIRGLGSQFNLTTFNGRVLATDNAGRDFSYDVLPAEALGSATVYKTPTAASIDGSIGGLVELTTIDPLARPGLNISGNVGGLYDEATGQVTPRFGATVSNTFADDTLGAFFGVYYYKRNWRSDTFESFARSTETVTEDGAGCFGCEGIGRAAFPGIVSYQVKNGPRERISTIGGVQWEPSDNLAIKVDAFYSRYDTPEDNVSYNINFYSNDGWARYNNSTVVPWAGPGRNNSLLTQFDIDNLPVELGTDTKARTVELWQVGWNSVWQATDNLEATLDVAYSQADRLNRGEDDYTVAGVTGAAYTYQLTNAAPNITCVLPNGTSCFDISNDQIALHFMERKGETTHDQAISSRLDFDYRAGQIGATDVIAKFGAFYFNRQKTKDYYASPDGCGYCGFTDTLGSVGVNAVVDFPYSEGYRSGTIGTDGRWPALSAAKLFEAAILARGEEYFNSTIAPVQQLRNSSFVDEDQYGGYLQFNVESTRLKANAGLRYVRTRDYVTGHTQQLLSLTPIPNSTNFTAVYSGVVPVSETNSYGNWLPSANVTYELRDNLQIRAALSKAITRPSFSQLGLDVNYEVNSPPPRVSQNGNPNLRATTANSLDLSIEWYGNQGSSASLAGFLKKIDGFITTGTFESTIAGQPGQITLPINGDTADLKGIEAAFQHVFDFSLGASVNYTFVDSTARLTLLDGSEVERDLDGVARHTVNASTFYEKGPLSLRLSYNFRAAFVDSALGGPVSTPSTTDASHFVDFSGSVRINPFASVYLDVSNITQESFHRYALDKRYPLFYEQFSRRFEFGVRASF